MADTHQRHDLPSWTPLTLTNYETSMNKREDESEDGNQDPGSYDAAGTDGQTQEVAECEEEVEDEEDELDADDWEDITQVAPAGPPDLVYAYPPSLRSAWVTAYHASSGPWMGIGQDVVLARPHPQHQPKDQLVLPNPSSSHSHSTTPAQRQGGGSEAGISDHQSYPSEILCNLKREDGERALHYILASKPTSDGYSFVKRLHRYAIEEYTWRTGNYGEWRARDTFKLDKLAALSWEEVRNTRGGIAGRHAKDKHSGDMSKIEVQLICDLFDGIDAFRQAVAQNMKRALQWSIGKAQQIVEDDRTA
ncbi:hypothetical protein K488DRAFT_71844 [Vararia minispora EC-137]|uniref:Uncharacterized protein n=1 Tax=Vararia minispora EC-137 TaxID=1314806 RepID=A0ACB8QH38_9AGAM|nr:hypothetical protein K488DRAFT_71844 [Vararia minispora EC-137]